jgi:hypothetical protein
MTTFIDGSLDRPRALFLLTLQDAAQRGMGDHWPKPRWIKFLPDGDSILVMVWMNNATAENYYTHTDPRRVIGHCDRVAFPDNLAAEYARQDFAAIAEPGRVHESFAPVQDGRTVRVLRFAYRVDTEQFAGFFCYGECPD